ncbi:MAG: hypothetical protein U0168_22700 [Nannocystaceae bacterium]
MAGAAEAPTMMALGPALALALGPGGRHRLDVPLPPAPREHFGHGDALVDGRLPRTARKPGTPTTLFVNFDGVDLGHCNPSNSIKNCHWYNDAEPIPAFSGSLQTKVSILQAMRRHADMFGVRITGVRPRSGHYTMLVYGGTEAQYGAWAARRRATAMTGTPTRSASSTSTVSWSTGSSPARPRRCTRPRTPGASTTSISRPRSCTPRVTTPRPRSTTRATASSPTSI